jgi:trehalose 6-phosphate phosphatase
MTRYFFDDMWSVGEQIARADSLLLCLEYDGVLAAEMEEDSLVSVSPQMQRVLWSLANQEFCGLAFVSHRSRTELQMRIGLPEAWYVGCLGLEISGPGNVYVHPAAAVYSKQLQPLAEQLNRQLGSFPDLVCEDRGLTLRVPFRHHPASITEQARHLTQDLTRRLAPMCKLTSQVDFLEVRPAVAWTRASAVQWIRQQLVQPNALVIYVGKDDEGTFLSLDDSITIRVDEPEKSAAQFYVAGPPDVRRFLEWVVGLARETQGALAEISG